MIVVLDFRTDVMVKTDHCDGILFIVSALLQILSRRSSRSQLSYDLHTNNVSSTLNVSMLKVTAIAKA